MARVGEKGREGAKRGENEMQRANRVMSLPVGLQNSSMATHERLRAWQLCHQLALAVYAATDTWPHDERYGLSTQARRAAHSAAANIAEGWARHGPRELRRYLSITRGSLAELSYTLRLAFDRGILPETVFHDLQNLRDAAKATTWKLFKAVSRKDCPVA
jgi:four helix bundle protein